VVVWLAIAQPCPLGLCHSTVCLPLATAAPARERGGVCLHSELRPRPSPAAPYYTRGDAARSRRIVVV